MTSTWKEALRDRRFKILFGSACCSLVILAFFLQPYFGKIIGPKQGIVLNDWVLTHLTPHDWSIPIFVLIYSFVLLTLLVHFRNPEILLMGLMAWSGVTWLRMLTIYLFTLEAPPGIIYLTDPFLFLVVYPQNNFAKDLFFSGHISTMAVIVFMEPIPKLKWLKAVAMVVVGILLLIQHVHYTVDVVLAPFFTYLVYRLAVQLRRPRIN